MVIRYYSGYLMHDFKSKFLFERLLTYKGSFRTLALYGYMYLETYPLLTMHHYALAVTET